MIDTCAFVFKMTDDPYGEEPDHVAPLSSN